MHRLLLNLKRLELSMKTEIKCSQTGRECHLTIEQLGKVVHERFMHFYVVDMTPHELGFAIEQGIWNYLDKHPSMTPAKERAKRFIDAMLQPPLLHGDDKHKEWLTAELK